MEQVNQKIISTRLCTNYSFVFQNHQFLGILVENSGESVFYSFNPKEEVPKVSDEILENALKALLKSKPDDFDIVTACFDGMEKKEEYCAIAKKVFQDYWNELYNLVFADMIFGREITLDSLDQEHDFWKENK